MIPLWLNHLSNKKKNTASKTVHKFNARLPPTDTHNDETYKTMFFFATAMKNRLVSNTTPHHNC